MAKQNEPFEICFVGTIEGEPPEGTSVVASDRDYVEVCKVISEPANRPHGVWVTSRPHYAWLQTYCKLIDLQCRSRQLTPRLILADRWGVSIPDWLDDEMVRSENLLNFDISPGVSEDFVDAILGHFLGRSFCAAKLEQEHVVEVLIAVVNTESKTHFDQYPVLRQSLGEKCAQWEKQPDPLWIGEFSSSLANRPDTLWHDLTLWSLLGRYPERLIEFTTGPQRVAFLRVVPVGLLSKLPVHLGAVEVALNQIEVFFNDIKGTVSSPEDLEKVLSAVSGRLPEEFSFVEQILESAGCGLQAKDIELVGKVFKTCPGISTVKIESLDRFVSPTKPTKPDAGHIWELDRWLKWTIEEYLPYRHWQTQNRQYDEQLEETVRAFSGWYVDEYTTIHQNSEKSLVHLLSEWRDNLVNDDLSLILLVDCLPVPFWTLFQEAMANVGFYRHQQEYRFVPLPSHTEVCKPLLLGSEWEKTDTRYADLLQERGRKDWPEKQVRYLHNLKLLSEVELPEVPTILVLNFLLVDKMLHTDVEADGSTHREELFRLFARLAEAVKTLFEQWHGQGDKFGVYAVTDHGATRILEEEKTSFDSKIVSRLFTDEKIRFAQIPPDGVAGVPENFWAFGHRFEPPFNSHGTVYFIPRGHNTVRTGSRSASFVHGGATPEEVVVPAAVFRPVRVAWRQPAVRFVNLRLDSESGGAIFFILRVVPIKIEIQNPNPEPVRVVRADVVSPDADVKEFTTPRIESQEVGELVLNCYFRKSAQGQEELLLQITYELAGEEHTVQALTAAVFKSATTGGFNLRDLS